MDVTESTLPVPRSLYIPNVSRTFGIRSEPALRFLSTISIMHSLISCLDVEIDLRYSKDSTVL